MQPYRNYIVQDLLNFKSVSGICRGTFNWKLSSLWDLIVTTMDINICWLLTLLLLFFLPYKRYFLLFRYNYRWSICINAGFLRIKLHTCDEILNWFLGLHCTYIFRTCHCWHSLNEMHVVASNLISLEECLMVILKVIKHWQIHVIWL